MEAWLLFAVEEGTQYGQWGIVGALLTFAAGVIAYLKHRDGEDRKERAEMSKSHKETIEAVVGEYRRSHSDCEQTIEKVVARHEQAVNTLTDSFNLTCAAQREEHKEDRQAYQTGLHETKNMLSQALGLKTLRDLTGAST